MVHICLHGLVIVRSESDRKKYINASLESCGDGPIDWDDVEASFQDSNS